MALVKRLLIVLGVAVALASAGVLVHLHQRHGGFSFWSFGHGSAAETPPTLDGLSDDFSRPTLDASRWEVVKDGALAQAVAEADPAHRQLRLGLGTEGTPGEPVKLVAVRTRAPLDLSRPHRIEFLLSWPGGQTGYLSAGVLLAPEPGPGGGSAFGNADWLRLAYVGVPPEGNVRAALYARKQGTIRWLYDDGWPLPNPDGRPIGHVKVTLLLTPRTIELREDGRTLLPPTPYGVGLARAYLSLFVTSRAGFPLREVRFADLSVSGS